MLRKNGAVGLKLKIFTAKIYYNCQRKKLQSKSFDYNQNFCCFRESFQYTQNFFIMQNIKRSIYLKRIEPFIGENLIKLLNYQLKMTKKRELNVLIYLQKTEGIKDKNRIYKVKSRLFEKVIRRRPKSC